MSAAREEAPSISIEPITTADTWTVSIAARVLGVSTAWLYALVDRNEIPHRRRGSLVFFDRRELSGWIRNRRAAAP